MLKQHSIYDLKVSTNKSVATIVKLNYLLGQEVSTNALVKAFYSLFLLQPYPFEIEKQVEYWLNY